jgi:hypothetical protein
MVEVWENRVLKLKKKVSGKRVDEVRIIKKI